VHIKKCVRSLARVETKESSKRSLTLLTAWGSGGRSSEVACVTIDNGLEFDVEMNAIVVPIAQLKSSNNK
jgi:hypothetical protein